jgi:hypothetical protein
MGKEDNPFEVIESEEEDAEIGIPIYKIRSYPADPTLENLKSGLWNT